MTDIYRALSDSTRRKILSLLAKRPCTQKDIVQCFDISQPAILKHLRILSEEGLIHEQKKGKYRVYFLNHAQFKVAYQHMVQEIESILDDQLLRLKNYVENEEER